MTTPLLTPRQYQILQMLAAGYREADMCKSLFLARSAITSHVLHLKKALGARTTAQCVHKAWVAGLLNENSTRPRSS